MAASTAEIQEQAAKLLEVLGVRMHNGQIVIHFSEGLAMKVDVNTSPWRRSSDERHSPLVKPRL